MLSIGRNRHHSLGVIFERRSCVCMSTPSRRQTWAVRLCRARPSGSTVARFPQSCGHLDDHIGFGVSEAFEEQLGDSCGRASASTGSGGVGVGGRPKNSMIASTTNTQSASTMITFPVGRSQNTSTSCCDPKHRELQYALVPVDPRANWAGAEARFLGTASQPGDTSAQRRTGLEPRSPRCR